MSRITLPTTRNILGPDMRRDYGAIVTVREQESEQTEVLMRRGTALEALREIVAKIDTWEGEWRISCISTPNTIYRDMQGDRLRYTRGALVHDPFSAERGYLQKIGRLDLLTDAAGHVPSLEPRRSHKAKR